MEVIMEEKNKSKKNFKEKTKEFFSKHKTIIIGTMSVGALAALIAYLKKNGVEIGDELYDSLLQKREEIRMNSQSENWESDLSKIDTQLRSISNPRREYSKTLSDDDLEKHIESTRSIWNSAREAFEKKTKGLSYRDYYKDPDKLELDKLYDNFYQSTLEKQYRYAKANPDKFPIHREHGWYLPNDD